MKWYWPLVALPLAGCGEVIGIEDAYYDDSVGTESPKSKLEAACAEYCDGILEACSGEHAQYPESESCLAVCRGFAPGSDLPEGENSLSCRMLEVELAKIEPELHCSFAGPGGNGACGTNCESFCSIAVSTCRPEVTDTYYPDLVTCLAECQALPDLGEYGAQPSNPEYTSGGHVQCRLYHVTAATLDPTRHCAHALGAAPCTSE